MIGNHHIHTTTAVVNSAFTKKYFLRKKYTTNQQRFGSSSTPHDHDLFRLVFVCVQALLH